MPVKHACPEEKRPHISRIPPLGITLILYPPAILNAVNASLSDADKGGGLGTWFSRRVPAKSL